MNQNSPPSYADWLSSTKDIYRARGLALAQKERLWSNIQTSVTQSPIPVFKASVWLKVLALSVPLLIGVSLSTLGLDPSRQGGSEQADQAIASGQSLAPEERISESPTPPQGAAERPVPFPRPRQSESSAQRSAQRQNGSLAESPSAGQSDTQPVLLGEAALVSRAHLALRVNNWTLLRETLQEHRTRFARGALVEERDALSAILGCHRGDEPSSSITRFRQQYPVSPLLPQVEARCQSVGED